MPAVRAAVDGFSNLVRQPGVQAMLASNSLALSPAALAVARYHEMPAATLQAELATVRAAEVLFAPAAARVSAAEWRSTPALQDSMWLCIRCHPANR